ncbi:hypothetical protein QE152_g40049 [Popillia japonica]|uniref:Uncharacterized protein n=1 Tax=Popillia japonica TaxID=7064 RepID=A0AAW1HS77_POPJA
MAEVLSLMGKLYNKTDGLRNTVKESTKIKTEIKTITRELVGIVGALRKKVDVLNQSHANLTAKCDEQAALLARKANSASTEQMEISDIGEILNAGEDFGNSANVIDASWSEASYT